MSAGRDPWIDTAGAKGEGRASRSGTGALVVRSARRPATSPESRTMIRNLILAAAVAAATGGAVTAQPSPRYPYPSVPTPAPQPSPVDGPWYFRGDPYQPCHVETVLTPRGPRLIFTNEKGTPAEGWLSRDGRRVTIPDWNLTGSVRGNALVWPNGDFWGR